MKIVRQARAKFALRKKKKSGEHVMRAMIMQAAEVAKEEAVGMEITSIGDMEVNLNVVETVSTGSPKSQFELDVNVMNATHENLDYASLLKQKSYSTALIDDDKSISSEESLIRRNLEESFVHEDDGWSAVSDAVSCAGLSCVSDAVSTHKNMNGEDEDEDDGLLATSVTGSTSENDKADESPNCVDGICYPITSASDFMFCQMKCAFPNAVEDMDEILSSDLHHLMFPFDGEVDRKEVSEAFTQLDDKEGDNRGVGYFQEEEVEVMLDCGLGKRRGRGLRSDLDEVDEEVKDEELIKGEQRSEDVKLSFEAHLENAAYSPGKGLVRKVGKLPQLLEDEVLIRVDATTISTRDCLEKLRRNNNKELFEELWVPGHEIVGRVVRAGTNSNAQSLSGKRIAALLPYGGGCSQYVRIKVKDAIELPKDAGSNDVVALLSTYMAAYQCLESVIEACLKVDGEGDDESGSIATNDNGQKESPLAGKNVMIYGAGSPAGLALVDLARSAGATVYAVSQKAHVSTMRDLGAYSWYGLNQRKVWEVKWKGTFDAIIDTVGDSHNYPSFFKVMKTRGRFARLNTTSCEQKHVAQMEKRGMWFGGYKELSGYEQRVFNDKTIDDYDIFHSVKKDKDVFEEDLAHLFQLLQAGNIKPKIVSRVGFDGLEGEWEKIMAGGTSGVAMVLPGANDDVFFYV